MQSWYIHRITSILSDKLGSEVRVGSVDIKFFSKLVLNDVYLEDERKDTLLTIQQLTADINVFSLNNKLIDVSTIDLYNANFHMKKYMGEQFSNIKFITDYFVSNKPDSLREIWSFDIGNISLHHCAYAFRDYNDTLQSKSKVNFKDLLLKDVNGQINNIHFLSDTTYIELKNLSFKDHSGFNVNGLTADAMLGPDKMQFDNLNVITDNTNISGNLKFSYDSLADFKNFTEKIRIESEFNNSKVSSSDIAFFVPALEGLDRNISLSGIIRGRITSLKGRNLDFRYNRSTRFTGNISLQGLPNVNETFIDLEVDNFYTTRGDLVNIPLPPFANKQYLQIPENIAALGNIKFKGKFTGFPSDFVAYGNLDTDLGSVKSDLNLKLDKKNTPSYSGKLIAQDFDIGTYFGLNGKIGRTSFEASINGKGIKLDDLNAEFDGIIHSLELNQYAYKNIYADGNIAKGLFSGALKVDEKNVSVDFDGTIDFTAAVPYYNFKAKINKVKLAELKLVDRDLSSNLIANADIKFSGDNLENIQGLIQLNNVVYHEGVDSIKLDYVTLVVIDDSINKSINLSSDLLDVKIDGTFNLNSIAGSIKYLISNYFPLVITEEITAQPLQAIKFEFDFKKTDDLFRIFKPGLSVSEDSKLVGSLNTSTEDLNFHLFSKKVVQNKFRFENIDIQGSTKDKNLNFISQIGKMFGRDSLVFSEGKIFGSSTPDSAIVSIALGENNPVESYLELNGIIKYIPSGGTVVSILPSNIRKFNEKWYISKGNQIVVANSKVLFNNLIFYSADQSIQIDGTLSENAEDIVDINVRNFDLKILNNALKMFRIQTSGIANGAIHLSSLTTSPLVTTNLTVNDLIIFGDTLGDAFINSNYLNNEKSIQIDASISRGGEKNINVYGKYFIKKPYDIVDVTVEAKRVNLSTVARYVQTVASDVKGLVSGKVKLTGRLNRPEINGIARIQKASFLVDYLNTRYNFTSDLELINDHILLKDVVLNDEDGSTALVNGKVIHNNLTKLAFDINIAATNFKCLNTRLSQNDLYYGKAYGTGKVEITGDAKLLKMNIGMKSERGTAINIPLSNPDEVSASNFITFINNSAEVKASVENAVDLKGIEMNFELEVTRDAEIQLIFDEKIGDVIKGTGTGNLILEIDRLGNFNMYGDYEVFDGKYDFTLQNVIDKKFRMVQGGTIRWNGDPYEAIIDLEAIYNLKANINDLIPSDFVLDSTSTGSNRVPVSLHLYITQRLLNPDIKMKIKFPDIEPSLESLVYRYVDTEQEINEQAFSLLILNRFTTPSEFGNRANTSNSSAVGANLSEFASNQLSAWASQLSSDLDVGVNYRAADALSQEEIEVALSTKILNDRVILDGNVGVSGQQSTNGIVGDFIVEVLLGKEGRFRVKAFNKSNNNTLLDNFEADYTQGIGVFYRKEFNTFSDIFKSYKKTKAIEEIRKEEERTKSSIN